MSSGGGAGMGQETEIAVLGGGCFWCLEALFKRIPGVLSVRSGYCGGLTANPSYESVCSGETGHAEVVEVRFDPASVSFRQLLSCFFAAHDPTTLNRQGNDVGSQYRSAIFPRSTEQEREAREVLAELNASAAYAGRVVTCIEPGKPFWAAESYHDDYFAKHPEQGYCAVVIAPKLLPFIDKVNRLLVRA